MYDEGYGLNGGWVTDTGTVLLTDVADVVVLESFDVYLPLVIRD